MRKFLLAAFLSSVGTGAIAADAVIYGEPVYEPSLQAQPGFSWSGAYIGVQAGHAWGKAPYYNVDSESADYDPEGFFGGVYAGYNHQFANNFVLGIDGDVNWSGIDSRVDYYSSGELWDNHVGVSDIDYTAAFRVRVAYAFDRWLPYLAGGVSLARFNFALDHDGTGYWDFEHGKTFTGWNIGAGFDYAATDNIIVRAEYRYSDYGSHSYSDSWVDFGEIKLRTHDVRLGVAYKF